MGGGIVGGVTGGSGVAAIRWFWRHQTRRFLRQQLLEHGIPICVKCGYDLTGNTSGKCPECFTESTVNPHVENAEEHVEQQATEKT